MNSETNSYSNWKTIWQVSVNTTESHCKEATAAQDSALNCIPGLSLQDEIQYLMDAEVNVS